MGNTVFQSDVHTSIESFQSIVTYIFIQFSETHIYSPQSHCQVIHSSADTELFIVIVFVTHIVVACILPRHRVILSGNERTVP